MYSFIYTIITAIIATTLFELGKYIVIKLLDKIAEKSLPFAISGFWYAYHECQDANTKEDREAYELILLKYNRGQVKMMLYQLTGDGRKYQYSGAGFFRGDKMTIAYEENRQYRSNKVGAFVLRLCNEREHSVVLKGQYHEIVGDVFVCRNNEYTLQECRLAELHKKRILSSKYVFKLMEKQYFKDACKNGV